MLKRIPFSRTKDSKPRKLFNQYCGGFVRCNIHYSHNFRGVFEVFLILLFSILSVSCLPSEHNNIEGIIQTQIGNLQMGYAVSLPRNFENHKKYHGIVAVPLGFPTPENAKKTIETYWKQISEDLDCVVVSPVAPTLGFFQDDTFKEAKNYFPDFLNEIRELYGIEQGGFVLVGAGHNGEFSFRLALSSPADIRIIVEFLGFSPDTDLLSRVYEETRIPVILAVPEGGKPTLDSKVEVDLMEMGVFRKLEIPAPSVLDGGLIESLRYVIKEVPEISGR